MYQLYSDYDKMNIVHVYTCTYMYKERFSMDFIKNYIWLILHPKRAVLMKELHDARSEEMLKNIKAEIKRRKTNNSNLHDHDL